MPPGATDGARPGGAVGGATGDLPGHRYGPADIVEGVPEQLMSVAHQWLVPDIPPAAAPTGSKGAVPPIGPDTPSEEFVRFLVVGLISGRAREQRFIVDNFVAPDVEFVHAVCSTRGRDNYYSIYRAATSYLEYRCTFHEIILAPRRAVVWLNLKVRMTATAWLPLVNSFHTFPCIVVLHFAHDPADGRLKIVLQHDHHTLDTIAWSGGAWSAQVASALVKPAMGLVFALSGKAFDDTMRWLHSAMQHVPLLAQYLRGPSLHPHDAGASAAHGPGPGGLIDSSPLPSTPVTRLNLPPQLAQRAAEWWTWGVSRGIRGGRGGPASAATSSAPIQARAEDFSAPTAPMYSRDPELERYVREVVQDVAMEKVEARDSASLPKPPSFLTSWLWPVYAPLSAAAVVVKALIVASLATLP